MYGGLVVKKHFTKLKVRGRLDVLEEPPRLNQTLLLDSANEQNLSVILSLLATYKPLDDLSALSDAPTETMDR